MSNNTPSSFLKPSPTLDAEEASLEEDRITKKRMRQECMNQEEGAAFSSPPDRRSALGALNVNKVGESTIKRLGSDVIMCQKETVSVDLGGKLKTLIEILHVTKLLVFLSHTDEDHINLIGHLPDVPAIFCVGGDIAKPA